jgi:hypothetical protein
MIKKIMKDQECCFELLVQYDQYKINKLQTLFFF